MLSVLLAGTLSPSHTVRGEGTPNTPIIARPTGPTGVMLPNMDPMASELQREIEHQRADYTRLITALAQARSEREAFAVQEELRQNQVALQVALLRIQASYARRAGRERLAWQFERTIDELITPESARIRQHSEPSPR